MDFYNCVDSICRQKGISISNMCDCIGISRSSPRGWKNGAKPQASTIKKIAAFFEVDISFFYDNKSIYVAEDTTIPVLKHISSENSLDATNIIGYEDIPFSMAYSREYFALRIEGHSMEPKMSDGDVVIVHKQSEIENDNIAIVLVGGEKATCKKIKKVKDGIILFSTNPNYSPMYFSNDEIKKRPIIVLGKVVELRAKL